MKWLIIIFLFSSLLGFSTHTGTIDNGNWSDINIWENEILPQNADTIYVRHYVNLNVNLDLNDEFLIITKQGTLCGNHYITIGYDAKIQNDGYLGANNVFVNGTYINNNITYADVTKDKKDGVIIYSQPINPPRETCPALDTNATNPINPNVQPLLIEKDTLILCGGGKLDVELPYTQAKYYWSDGSENGDFAPEKEGQFFVTIITNNDTLYDSLIVLINENLITIPNIFTPNNDGINDDFLPIGLDLTSLQFYNRWGREIISCSSVEDMNYSKLNDGVYYYILKHNDDCLEKNPVKGWVEISR